MMQLKQLHPIARKEHICMFCGGIIEKGEKYDLQTNVDSGYIYDWITHDKCSRVASELGMYDDLNTDGITDEDFRDNIQSYVYNNHYDNINDDIDKDWQLPCKDLVEKIYDEI